MTTRGLSVKKKPVDGAAEPVTLEELKLHVAIDFDDHDDLLNMLLSSARESVEMYTGLSLIESNVSSRWEALTTANLPYGPVKSITSGTGSEYILEGLLGGQMSINANSSSSVTIEYVGGYDEVPEALKLAIMKLATDNFTKRSGIDIATANAAQLLPNNWKSAAAPYSVKSWFL